MYIPQSISQTRWTQTDKELLAKLIAKELGYIIRFKDNSKAGYKIMGSESGTIGINPYLITDFLKVIKPLSTSNNPSSYYTEEWLDLNDGWMDAEKLKKSLDSRSAITGLIMSDLESVTYLKNIQICTKHYEVPTNANGTNTKKTPYYITTSGWGYSVCACKEVKHLPQSAKTYLGIVQGILNKLIYIIVVDEGPKGIITVDNPLLDYRPPKQ